MLQFWNVRKKLTAAEPSHTTENTSKGEPSKDEPSKDTRVSEESVPDSDNNSNNTNTEQNKSKGNHEDLLKNILV